jgi:protein-disulfide isomerase
MAKKERSKKEREQNWLVIAGIVAIALLVTWVLVGQSWTGFTEAVNAGPDPSVPRGVTEAGYHYLGDLDAPVKMVLYEDYACPNCRNFFEVTEDALIENYIATGDVLLELHPIAIISANSLPAAQAVFCAAEQGAFWEYRELVYLNQGNLAFRRDNFGLIAERLGLDRDVFVDCFDRGGDQQEIQQQSQAAQNFGVEGTPTFIIAGERFPKLGETALPDVFAILDEKIAEATNE